MDTLIYLLQVTACTAVFYLFYFLFLSRLTFFTTNRYYLLATVLLSFTLPWLRITLNEQQPYVAAVQQIIYVPQTVTFNTHNIVQPTPVVAEPIHWKSVVKVAYFAMAAGLGIHLLITLLSFFKHIKGKRVAKIGKVKVLSGQQKIANGSFLNYIFLNDEELSADELQQIIAHEMLHIKFFHSADRILVKIAQIVLWFNPFIYLYARSVEENHEFEVDREIARSTDKHNYANLLLHLSVAGQGMLYHNFSKVPLKKRISMLFNKPSNKMKRIVYVLIVPVVLISCLAFARLKKAGNVHQTPDKKRSTFADWRKKAEKEFDDWKKTDDYKQKYKLNKAIYNGGLISVKVKQKINGQSVNHNKSGFVITYNNREYFISTWYGQQKQLNKLLIVGDRLRLKVFSSGFNKANALVDISPAFVIKNKSRIFQLAEAAPISKQPFLTEAGHVHYADGQINVTENYPNGKWKSAVLEEVNGYKFYLKFKPNAPYFTGIENYDHVRLRFVNEVARGYKEYFVNGNWVSISEGDDYGIKNPELFNNFYKKTTEHKSAKENQASDKQYYIRLHKQKADGSRYDEIVVSMPSGGKVGRDILPADKVGFIIDKKLYNEAQFKKTLPSVITSFTGEYGTGGANNKSLNHGIDTKGYNVIFSFNTRKNQNATESNRIDEPLDYHNKVGYEKSNTAGKAVI